MEQTIEHTVKYTNVLLDLDVDNLDDFEVDDEITLEAIKEYLTLKQDVESGKIIGVKV